MFVAAMLDALPELRERVLADAARRSAAGHRRAGLSEAPAAACAAASACAGSPARTPRHERHAHDQRCARPRRACQLPRHGGAHRGGAARAAARRSTRSRSCTILGEAEAAIHRRAGSRTCISTNSPTGIRCSTWSPPAASPPRCEGARWTVSALPRGGGLVRTQHGLLPVPAPPRHGMLTGFAWRDDGIDGERVTPTGAAILRHLVATGSRRGAGGWQPRRHRRRHARACRACRTSCARWFSRPNGATACRRIGRGDRFEIDDMTGEEIAVAADRLEPSRASGISFCPCHRQEGPAIAHLPLARDPGPATVTAACFSETSTIGLRWQMTRRAILPRVKCGGRLARVKTVTRPAGPSRRRRATISPGLAGLDARRAAERRRRSTLPRARLRSAPPSAWRRNHDEAGFHPGATCRASQSLSAAAWTA